MTTHGETLPAETAPRAQQHIALNVVFGVPDDGKSVVRVSADGRKLVATAAGADKFRLRGSANIAPFLSERFALNRYFLQDDPAILAQIAPGPILNHIADPDICSKPLALLERLTDRERRRCFNHPRSVARTTRDGVARLLTGRWIIARTRWNLELTGRYVKRYASPEPVENGTFTFYIARKRSSRGN